MAQEVEIPRQVKRAVEWAVKWPLRMRHGWRNRDRLEAWRGAVASVLRAHNSATSIGLKTVPIVHNVSLYLLLFDHDLHWLVSDMINALDEERRQFTARQMAVQLYEALEDLPKLLGKQYRDGLIKLGLADLLSTADAIGKQVHGFKTRHAQDLKKIRIVAGAHRDKDAVAPLTLMETINPLTIFQRAAELSDSLRALIDHLIQLTLKTANCEVMARDFVK